MLDPVDVTLQLCRIPSPTGEEAAVMEYAAGLCARLGLKVVKQTVGAPDRVNLLATDADVAPELLFTTHLDTVPPFIPPEDKGDVLTGRGTCDAKGAAAAMLCALEQLRQGGERRVGLMLLVGEETSSDGAKAAARGLAPPVRFFINGEPTQLKLAQGQKGTLVFVLKGNGIACHSAYPELGSSAVHALIESAHALLAEPWPTGPLGDTTLNIGTISGGLAPNVLAPSAEARGIFRLTVPAADVEHRARQLLPNGVELEKIGATEPTLLHVPDGLESEVVRFGSDVPHLKGIGTPLMVGPGSIHDAHTNHECVRKADLHAAVTLYTSLAQRLLS